MTLIVYMLAMLQFILSTEASLSPTHSTPNASLSLSIFILVDGNPIFLVAQANTLISSFIPPFHASHPIGQEILLTQSFKYIQILVTSHHLHCYHHRLPGLLSSRPSGSILLPLHSLVCLQHGSRVIL